MKKTILTLAIALIIAGSAMAQPVSDRAVIPVAVTLNQILRIHVVNGGNIEFVFNMLDDYKFGIANGATGFYTSDIVVASSTDWQLDMGTEDATFMGTDDPVNTMPLDNVGFTTDWVGLNTCCGALLDVDNTGAYTNNISAAGAPLTANGLLQYTGVGTAVLYTSGIGALIGNGGDINDNAFSILWECGTFIPGGTSPMNVANILDQNLLPDRYVTNVMLELTAI